MKKNIAIYGGTFDPPTSAHMNIVQFLINKVDYIDDVWVMPCERNLLKKEGTPGSIRLQMCEIFFKNIENCEVSDFNIKNSEDKSTFEMMKILLDLYGDEFNFYFVIGLDNAIDIGKWKNCEELINLVPFIVFHRDNCRQYVKFNDWFVKEPHKMISLVDGYTSINISSTEIRNYVEKVKMLFVKDFLSNELCKFIEENNLYES